MRQNKMELFLYAKTIIYFSLSLYLVSINKKFKKKQNQE